MRVLFKFFVLLVVIFCAGSTTLFLFLNTSPADMPFNDYEFHIKDGMSASKLADNLQSEHLIRSGLFFKVLIRISQLDKNLKAGYILVSNGMKTTDIMKKILYADFITISLTIPEGYSLKEINNVLITKNLVTKEEIDGFLNKSDYTSIIGLKDFPSAEGFLFPETYTFHKGVKIEKIYSTMVKLFFVKLNETSNSIKSMKPDEMYKKLIIASIIEKEVRNREEASLVAGIFYNRLNLRMKLQSCATVQYILDKPKERLLFDDLLIPSPYNTYLNEGVPPGPISSPGLNSLKAAFNPEKTDYLYFVVKDPIKGSHHFSVEYDEHLRAQKRYKSIQGFE